MGALGSKALRRINRFNIDNRAHRVIADPTPRPAPKHEKTLREIETMEKEMPGLKDEILKFDKGLNERLKQVYVSSADVMPPQSISKKLPPLSHKVRRTSDFGFDDEEAVGQGRLLLRHAIEMLSRYQKDEDISIKDLAKKYEISHVDAGNIIKYYSCFRLVLPQKAFDKDKLDKILGTMMVGQADGKLIPTKEFMEQLNIDPQYETQSLTGTGTAKLSTGGNSEQTKLDKEDKSPDK